MIRCSHLIGDNVNSQGVQTAILIHLLALLSFLMTDFSQYSLIKDVVSSLKKHRMHDQQFTHHPLLVLNNFGSDGMQVKLMATMFQHMFPSINVHKVGSFISTCYTLVDSRFKASLA